MPPPLGIVADEIARHFPTAVQIGTALGLRRYEIRHLTTGRAPLCAPSELAEIERIVANEGLEITALSPGLFKTTADPATFRRDLTEIYPRAADLARRWNLPGLIAFGFARGTPNVRDFFAEAQDRAAADGLLLIVEPEPICEISTARAAAALNLRINYDPGNVAWLQNRDPLDEFSCAASLLANVHIKDMLPLFGPAHDPQWVPAGEGLIDYRAHFAALRQSGYNGPISLEPHMDGRPETIRRCKEAFEKCWKDANGDHTP